MTRVPVDVRRTGLRRAVEVAFDVARRGAAADPPVEPPSALRRFVRFQRLAGPAVDVVRSCVETDDGFRHRVRDATSEADVGEAGWLWLDRPTGWEERLEGLAAASDEAEAAEHARRHERDADRRIALADEARRMAEAEVAEEQRRRREADGVVAEERQRRHRLEEQLRRAADERSDLVERVARAERRATRAEGGLGDERARRRALAEELAEVEERLARAQVEPAPAAAAAGRDDGGVAGTVAGTDDGAPHGLSAPDRVALARFVGEAATSADRLAEALRAAAAVVGLDHADPGAGVPAVRARPTGGSRRRRRALRLPRAMLEESVDAAAHLLGRSGALVLVDGYNVTLRRWPDLPLGAQRTRLLNGLAALASGPSAEIRVVFDGAETLGVGSELPPRCPIEVEFTAPGVEADDRILDVVDDQPPERVLVVVSDDRRVRDGAGARGANVVGSDQLLALIT